MRPNSVDKICENCGADYRVQAYRSEQTKFCSMACMYEGRPKPKRQEIQVVCQNCSTEFVVAKYREGKVKFCSRRCTMIASRPAFEEKRYAGVKAIIQLKASDDVRAAKKKALGEKYYVKNKKRLRKNAKVYYSKNKHIFRAGAAKYEADKIRATPSWADHTKIRAVYKEAARLTADTGIQHEVDHYYPLRSKIMCGLHVETNLQILTAEANRKKSNSIPTEEEISDGSIEEAEGRARAA